MREVITALRQGLSGVIVVFGALAVLLLMLVGCGYTQAAHAAGSRHHHSRYYRYDGPRSDYSTRWYGENAGTVHYGY